MVCILPLAQAGLTVQGLDELASEPSRILLEKILGLLSKVVHALSMKLGSLVLSVGILVFALLSTEFTIELVFA